MRIRLNGQPKDVAPGTTVAALIASLGVVGGVAVAVDRRVVPRSAHADTALHDGAEVEVIRAVGGG